MVDVCPGCDTEVRAGARFCSACGVRLDVAVIHYQHQDDADAVAANSPLSRVLVTIGILAALCVVGVELFAGGPEPQPEADLAEPTPIDAGSSEAENADPAGGEGSSEAAAASEPTDPPTQLLGALAWSKQAVLGDASPLGIEQVGGTTFILASALDPRLGVVGGLVIWASVDDRRFEALGQVLPDDVQVSRITSTSTELLAAGRDADRRLTLWRSTDGQVWNADTISTASAIDRSEDLPTNITAAKDTVLIATQRATPRDTFSRMQAALGDSALRFDFNSPTSVIIRTGLGLPIAELAPEELGVTTSELEAMMAGTAVDNTGVWFGKAGQWRVTQFPGAFVSSMAPPPDAGVLLVGGEISGNMAHVLTDGTTWTAATADDAQRIAAWDLGMAAVSHNRIGFSTDGDNWRWTAIKALAASRDNWHISGLQTSADMVVALAHSFSPDDETASVVLLRDGYSVRFEPGRGSVTVSAGGRLLYDVPLWSAMSPIPEITGDLSTRTVTFLDTRTGTAGPTFTFGELIDAERSSRIGSQGQTTVLATHDGLGYYFSDMSKTLRPDQALMQVQPLGDNLVALVLTRTGASTLGELEVWTAPVPNRGLWTGALPDGTRFELRGDPDTAAGRADSVSANILVDLPGGPRVAGVASFGPQARLPPGQDRAPTSNRGIYRSNAGNWGFTLALYPDVIDALGGDADRLLVTSLRTSLDAGLPVIELAPPFSWADDPSLPSFMEVVAGPTSIRHGCGEAALACSDDGLIQAVLSNAEQPVTASELTLSVIPNP